jgi:hypothetical protein
MKIYNLLGFAALEDPLVRVYDRRNLRASQRLSGRIGAPFRARQRVNRCDWSLMLVFVPAHLYM